MGAAFSFVGPFLGLVSGLYFLGYGVGWVWNMFETFVRPELER